MYDAIIIWSWAWWLTCAFWLAWAGKKVLLIEKWKIGWDCTNIWCIPSKALLNESKKNLSFEEIFENVRKKREKIRDEETPEILKSHGIELKFWEWKVIWKNKISVWNEVFKGKNIIVSSWSRSNLIEIKWVKKENLLTNENVFELRKKFDNLAIIWGWYIAIELWEAFLNMWINVHFIIRWDRLLRWEEFEVSSHIEDFLLKKWAKIHKKSEILEVKWEYFRLKKKEIIEEIKVDKILVATWRKRNFEDIFDNDLGIKLDDGIVVDKYNRTNIQNIFAIWDCVNWNEIFTHNANNEWRWVVRNILVPFFKKEYRKKAIPKALFTEIELAKIGKIEDELKEEFGENWVVSITKYFSENDKSKVTSDEIWFVKINFDRFNGQILWASIFWKNASEIVSVLASYMDNKISAFKASEQIFPYPTKGEIIKKIASEFTIYYLKNFKGIIFDLFKKNFVRLTSILIWIFLIIFFYYYKVKNGLSIEEIAINIMNYLMWTGLIWAIIYIFIYAIRPLVFFPATLMTIMSWVLFGGILWTIYTVIWETLSAWVSYFFGKNLSFEKLRWNWFVRFIKEKADKDTFWAILLTRLLFFPFDLVNYASGLLKIKFKPYILATFIGIIPGAAAFVFLGASFHSKWEITSFSEIIQNFNSTNLYIGVSIFLFALLLSKLIKRVKK